MNPRKAFENRTARLVAEGAHKDRVAYSTETPQDDDAEFQAWVAAGEEMSDSLEYFNPIEMGMYDDDPNPYHGDYSEM